MSHIPNLQDAACDLLRCIDFTNYQKFLDNAENILESNSGNLSPERLLQIKSYLKKGKDTHLSLDQKREHLLTASILLQNSYQVSRI